MIIIIIAIIILMHLFFHHSIGPNIIIHSDYVNKHILLEKGVC